MIFSAEKGFCLGDLLAFAASEAFLGEDLEAEVASVSVPVVCALERSSSVFSLVSALAGLSSEAAESEAI